MTIVRQSHFRGGLGLSLRCEWPAGTQCPGQILLRARVRVGQGRHSRLIRAVVARRGFVLLGGEQKSFRVALTRRGRELAAGSSRLRAHLTVAIPGGKIARVVTLRP